VEGDILEFHIYTPYIKLTNTRDYPHIFFCVRALLRASAEAISRSLVLFSLSKRSTALVRNCASYYYLVHLVKKWRKAIRPKLLSSTIFSRHRHKLTNSINTLSSKMNSYNSSSSSSDNYDPNAILEFPIVRRRIRGRRRRERRRPKVRRDRKDWHTHAKTLRDTGEFKTKYRMTYQTFEKLVDILGDITVDELQSVRSTSGNPPIAKEVVIGAGIRHLSGDPTSAVADIFGMSRTSTTT